MLWVILYRKNPRGKKIRVVEKVFTDKDEVNKAAEFMGLGFDRWVRKIDDIPGH